MAGKAKVGEGYVEITTDVDDNKVRKSAEKAGDDFEKSFSSRVGSKLKTGLSNKLQGIFSGIFTKVLPAMGAALNLGLALGPMFVHMAIGIVHVVSAAGAAAPALLSLGASFGILMAVVKGFGPAFQQAFTPVTDALDKAELAAGRLAVKGLQPLASSFVKLNMPAISSMMNRIGVVTNQVAGGFLRWANSSAGVAAIRNIMAGVADLAERIGPSIQGVVISFVAMLGRIAKVSSAAGGNGLAGALDKVNGWLDKITAASVQSGLDRLRDAFHSIVGGVTTLVGWIRTAIRLFQQYRPEIYAIADVLGVLAIAFGGPVVAIGAAVGMIIRHFDLVKAAVGQVRAFFSNPVGAGFLDNLRKAAEVLWPALVGAFNSIKAQVLPVLQAIWGKISGPGGLIQSFGEFLAAVAPLVAWFVGVLGPVVGFVIANVLTKIEGFVQIITGIFQILTGILTGNWSKAWEGVKNIFGGAVKVLLSKIALMPSLMLAKLLKIIPVFAGVFSKVSSSAASWASKLLADVGRWLGGLPGKAAAGVRNLWSAMAGAFSSAASGARAGAERLVSGAIGILKGLPAQAKAQMGRARDAIKGAFAGAGGWLVGAGGAILRGLVSGLRGAVGAAVGAAVNAAKSVISGLKGALGIHSPSKVAAKEVGRWIPPGIAQGVEDAMPAANARIKGVAPAAVTAAASTAVIPAQRQATSSVHVEHLEVNVTGVLDPSNPVAARKLAAMIFESIKKYERSYA